MGYVVLNGVSEGAQTYETCIQKCFIWGCTTAYCPPNNPCSTDCNRLGCGQGGKVTPYSLFD
ncbi:hypothetical protein [Clostridium sp.]|uniref:hypothetical protein n=1 Tax=Clostridium sp. TaxID=1506 RepID=UPI0026376B38|nr:hypothetical protein [Clostridium sp.]